VGRFALDPSRGGGLAVEKGFDKPTAGRNISAEFVPPQAIRGRGKIGTRLGRQGLAEERIFRGDYKNFIKVYAKTDRGANAGPITGWQRTSRPKATTVPKKRKKGNGAGHPPASAGGARRGPEASSDSKTGRVEIIAKGKGSSTSTKGEPSRRGGKLDHPPFKKGASSRPPAAPRSPHITSMKGNPGPGRGEEDASAGSSVGDQGRFEQPGGERRVLTIGVQGPRSRGTTAVTRFRDHLSRPLQLHRRQNVW